MVTILWWLKIFSHHKDGQLKKFNWHPLSWSNFFDYHTTHPHHWMLIKILQSPKRENGAWNFFPPKMIAQATPLSVAIWWWGYVGWQLNFFGGQKGGAHVIAFFEKKSSPPCPLGWLIFLQSPSNGGACWMTTQKFQLPSLWWPW